MLVLSLREGVELWVTTILPTDGEIKPPEGEGWEVKAILEGNRVIWARSKIYNEVQGPQCNSTTELDGKYICCILESGHICDHVSHDTFGPIAWNRR